MSGPHVFVHLTSATSLWKLHSRLLTSRVLFDRASYALTLATKRFRATLTSKKWTKPILTCRYMISLKKNFINVQYVLIDKIRLAGYSGNCTLKLILNLRRINLYEKLKTSSTILVTQNCARSLIGNSTLYSDKNLLRHWALRWTHDDLTSYSCNHF